MQQQTLIERRLEIIEEEQRLVRHTLFGNGREGLDEVVRGHTRKLDSMGDKLDAMQGDLAALVKQGTRETGKREGQRETIGWIRFWLATLVTLVTLGGAVGAWQVSSKWEQVESIIRSLPAPPQ